MTVAKFASKYEKVIVISVGLLALMLVAYKSVSENLFEDERDNFSVRPIATFKTRNDLTKILETEKLEIGAELGVQAGVFAFQTLSNWPSCKKYVLVDIWARQDNYLDLANDKNHERLMNKTLKRLQPFKEKIEVCRNYTSVCRHNYPDGFFDYIYIDARHDYKGVTEDLFSWWPKLRVGGIFSGHDYVEQNDGPAGVGQDWSLNYDGTIDDSGRAVKGAVDDFAQTMGRQLIISYRENMWNTWALRK